MGHQAGFMFDDVPEIVVDLGRVNRGEAQARQVRQGGKQAAHELAEFRLAGEIRAVGGEIDAGENDFLVAVGEEGADLRGDGTHRDRAGWAAPVGDDAEGAAMIAALLDFDKGARSGAEPIDQVGGGLAHLHDVRDQHGFAGDPGGWGEFFDIADHTADAGHCAPGLRVNLGRAASDDDGGVRMGAMRAADFLPGLAFGFAGHSTGIDDDGVVEAGRFSMAAHDFALETIEAAAEGANIERHCR